MKYHFKIQSEKKGYSAFCIELEGCQTQADSKTELLRNMEEALNLYLSEPFSSRHVFVAPKKDISGRNIVAVSVAPSVAFANRMREIRIRYGLTQVEMKKTIGHQEFFELPAF